MQGKVTLIAVDGKETVTEFNAPVSLDFMQAAVGGNIEIVPYFDRFRGDKCVAICNEEGKINDLPFNPKASEHWDYCKGPFGDALFGPVIIVQGDAEFMRSL